MTWLSDLVEKHHGGPVERYRVEMEPFERAVLRSARHRLLCDLEGRILELGCGLGESFPLYDGEAHVLAIEPFTPFRLEALKAAAHFDGRVMVEDGDAHALRFADQSFDALAAFLVVCTLSAPGKALREARRVLKPGAPARFLEHVRATGKARAGLQAVMNPLWKLFDGSGCELNRRTPALIEAAGFRIERVVELPVPHAIGVLFPLVEIYARA